MNEIKQQKTSIIVAIGVAIFTMALMLFQFFYIGVILKKQAEKYSKEIATQTAQKIANSVEVYFRDAFILTQTYSRDFLVYKEESIPRSTAYKLLYGSLSQSENLLDIWTMWEKNAYDNKDSHYINDGVHNSLGSFGITYYYDGSEIKTEITAPDDYNSDYYTIPKMLRKPVIMDPFYYQFHGNPKSFFVATLAYPIIENNEYLGVVGIDVDMYGLQSRFSKNTVYDDGYISLLSNSGIIVTHKFPQNIEKNISEFTTEEIIPITELIKSEKEFSTESYSTFLGENVVRYFYPVDIKNIAAPWYVMIEIPRRKILEDSNSLKLISSILLGASLVLLFYLFYNIIDRNRREKKLLDTIQKVELGELQIKESEVRYKKLIEAFPDLIIVTDLSNQILYANPAMEAYEGKSIAELQNGIGVSTIHPDDVAYVQSEIDNILTIDLQNTGIIENRVIKNGEIFWRSSIICKIKFDGEPSLLYISKDITEKKRIEEELEKYRNNLEILVKDRTDELAAINEELNSTNEELYEQREELQASLTRLQETQKLLVRAEKMASLGILAAGVAHEINNPLNFIHGGATYLETFIKENFNERYDELKSVIDAIHTGVKRATAIVKSLNQYSRSDALPFTNCNIHDIIDDCLVMLHNQYKNRIEVQKQYTENPIVFKGNEGKLHQVFLNILTNALHAIADKGKISIISKIVKEAIHIEISDTGSGISFENLKKIFDPFFTTKDPGKGIGLGLSIAHSIIQEHNGSIEFDSKPGKGTTAIICLPLKQVDANNSL